MAGDARSGGLFEEFQRELKKLGGEARAVESAKLGEEVSRCLSGEKAERIVGYLSPYLAALKIEQIFREIHRGEVEWLPAARPAHFDMAAHRRRLAEADLAVTSADFLLARTATAVFSLKHHPSGLLTLLPPSLLVIAPAERLLADFPALQAIFDRSGEDRESNLVFFTGPSRTADIEKTLVLGVHGPKKLTVLVVDVELNG
ncbi:MAG: LUD domain-containing protein [Calditrichaceae bacterium]|nr:lactate utilization protein [Calditrichia bacterium]NUQ43147.1 LUD domain-containing protein [Calditrichaceae bacterium]